MKTIVAAISIEDKFSNHSNRYKYRSKILIDTTLKFTNFDILLVTNDKSYYEEYNDNPRVFIEDFREHYPDDKLVVCSQFNYNLKRCPIRLASKKDYDYIIYKDCDCFFSGMDEQAYKEMLDEGYDIYYATFYPHHTVNDQISKPWNHPNTESRVIAMGDLVNEDLKEAVLAVETKIVYKNTDKMQVMLDRWDAFSYKCEEKNCPTIPESLYFCMAGRHAKMEPIGVSRQSKLANYFQTMHGCHVERMHGEENPVKILDYFGLLQYRLPSEEALRDKLGI